MGKYTLGKNTDDVMHLHFEPDDGTCYQLHITPDRYGGVLIASTLGSKGLYRWFPEDGEIKILAHDGFGPYFAKRVHQWLDSIFIDGQTVAEIAMDRWC